MWKWRNSERSSNWNKYSTKSVKFYKKKKKRSRDFIVTSKRNKKRDVSEIFDEKSLHHNDNDGNLSNLKNLNGLTEDENQNLEKGGCIQYDEKDCLKSEEETWLKLTPKNNDLKKTVFKEALDTNMVF